MTVLVGIQAQMFTPAGDLEADALPPDLVVIVQRTAPPAEADLVPEPESDLSHRWAIAAIAIVDHKTAKHANLRGSFRTADRQLIEALDTYCAACRRPFDDVADLPCEAAVDNTHLIGGDPGVRKKRLVYESEGEIVAGPSVSRMGAEAFVDGDGAPVG